MDETRDLSPMLSQLTLEEKLWLLAGQSQWQTAAVPRLGIPSLKVGQLTFLIQIRGDQIELTSL